MKKATFTGATTALEGNQINRYCFYEYRGREYMVRFLGNNNYPMGGTPREQHRYEQEQIDRDLDEKHEHYTNDGPTADEVFDKLFEHWEDDNCEWLDALDRVRN